MDGARDRTDPLFILLQINDAAFPIGAYTHSYALETYIQEGLVNSARDAAVYIERNLRTSFLYSDLLAAKLAYEAASRHDLDELARLEDLIFASRIPREPREASRKLGTRFIKTAGLLRPRDAVFSDYAGTRAEAKHVYAVAYGVFAAAAGIGAADGLAAFLYAQAAAMTACCVKTIPLSQTDGQRILSDARGFFAEILESLEGLDRGDLCRSCPGLDIRAMRHETLYSRLYMS
jgi:urease accessory protein